MEHVNLISKRWFFDDWY